ncbi:MAG: FMN-binding glutamate synthase family protein [Flavobacteriales bacterium]|nr:FMN-binding glutamate synthase family protein [Flavobacteriales bacterium]
MRHLFYRGALIVVLLVAVIGYFHPAFLWAFVVVVPLLAIGLYDVVQSRHTILRNFPVLGYLRYFFEFIAPEIQQYFIERHTDGRPFSRQQRALAYTRAKNVSDTTPFGTQLDINAMEYEGIRHSIYPAPVKEEPPRVHIGGALCAHPYEASLLNISAMSFGALSANAVLALNAGAKKGGFYHNTGEGGLCDYHLHHGGDVVWQIGTGYFGCRDKDGGFDAELFRTKAAHTSVKMIELKISQGAKPGHGGVLPASKNTEEIARFRHVAPHTTVLSPPGHGVFQDAAGLIDFVQRLRELSGGKPVGFKLCIGRTEEFVEICRVMKEKGIRPDFITVDGAEGGTGAAPLEFADTVGMPIEPALIFVHRTLKRFGLRDEIRVIASGKVLTAASLLKMLAMGADLCNSARGFMFALGCIQALRCNTNKCPTGVATQDRMLMKGLAVGDKSERVFQFHRNTLHAAMELMAAAGKHDISEVAMDMFLRGDEFVRLEDRYFPDSLGDVRSDEAHMG